MTNFFNLEFNEITKETEDSVSISIKIPEQLKETFSYVSGQYITLKHNVNNQEVIRSYSLCSSPFETDFRIGVKKIENGLMSTYLNEDLKVDGSLEVMAPEGNFSIHPNKKAKKNYVGVAAGSGITPILSMLKSVLLEETRSTFTLYYVNKTERTSMFKNEIEDYLNRYPKNLKVVNLYTQQNQENPLFNGRITKEKFENLMKDNKKIQKSDGVFICGPEDMIFDVSTALTDAGCNKDIINYELFGTPVDKMKQDAPQVETDFEGESQVTVIMDGDEFEFPLRNDGNFILDASIENGADAPFSCKGAVCCTCKAQVIEGKAIMDMNYALSDEEVEEGFILTCQARPASAKLVVDYDVS
jgi:ring-1,2-phenylacetyl-CoA epoxidase subunit PaaE